ncbi:MAG: 4-hydroxythreonine-4-phosphate dehydrogenase PdxA [Woeseiaceae bacterium]|nr:4-hydroxythreonine-4-phosphate dehydrogenase PdxA [Woeseiaceae bacterium]
MTEKIRPLVVTSGEPAGIGPDLCLALAASPWKNKIVVIGDPGMLAERAKLLGVDIAVRDYDGKAPRDDAGLQVLSQPLSNPAVCGRLDPANARSLLDGLERAVKGCLSGEFSGMVTAPLQKSVINDAGIKFSGHTEYLASLTGAQTPVMLLVAGGLRVALVTTHLPLSKVPAYLTVERITEVIGVLHDDLHHKFDISNPRILVCGLNPHAGEGGHLGTEERDVIEPALERLRARNMDIVGPLPADTVFTPVAGPADAIVAMYHDQGLPVLKYAGFGRAVNVTLGLPIIRTSVDHGTALDIAGKGTADAGSMLSAVDMAAQLANKR